MYALEEMDGFEQEYVNSLKRKASDITIMNLSALFNSGVSSIGNEKMEDLLIHIMNNTNTTSTLLEYIKEEFVIINEEVEDEIEVVKNTSDKSLIENKKKWWEFWK